MLPPENNENIKALEEEAEGSLELPEIDLIDIDNQNDESDDFVNVSEDEGMSKESQDIQNELKRAYESLMGMFRDKGKSSDDLLEIYEEEIRKRGLYSLEGLEQAIESGDFDLSKYDIFTMNRLITRLEKDKPPESLDSYNIKTLEDFYEHVTSGKLDVSMYKVEDIDELVDRLVK